LLQEHLDRLPEATGFDFRKASLNLIADQGFKWFEEHTGLLESEAEYLAQL
jgi:hypothetical protein